MCYVYPRHRRLKHHVFLCHGYGDRSRYQFVNHLHHSLSVARVVTVSDDEAVAGLTCPDDRFQVVEESRMSLVVLSPAYVSSRWCLEVILKIVSCWAETGHDLVPILDGVDRYQVERELISFLHKEHTAHPVKHYGKTIAQWREILMLAMDLPGWDITGWAIDPAAKMIVRDVLAKLASPPPSSYSIFQTIMDADNFMKPVEIDKITPSEDVCERISGESEVLCLHGMTQMTSHEKYSLLVDISLITPENLGSGSNIIISTQGVKSKQLSHLITWPRDGSELQLSVENLNMNIKIQVQGASVSQEQAMTNSFMIHEPIEEPTASQQYGTERLSVSSSGSSSETSLDSPEICHSKGAEMGKLQTENETSGKFRILFSSEGIQLAIIIFSIVLEATVMVLEQVQSLLPGLVMACVGASLNVGVILYQVRWRMVNFHSCFELAVALCQAGTSSVGFWYSRKHLPSPIRANMTMLLYLSLLLLHKFFKYRRR